MMVNIEQLVVSNFNIRKSVSTDDDEFKEILSSVSRLDPDTGKPRGVNQALLVRMTKQKTKDDKPVYEIIDGQRRYLAAKMAGIPRVPADMTTEKDEAKLILMSASRNLHRADVTPFDMAHAVKRLMDMKDDDNKPRFPTARAVAEELGVSPARVSSWLAHESLPDAVREAAESGKLKMRAVEKVAQGFDEHEEMEAAAAVAAEIGGTAAEQVEVVKAVREKRDLLKLPEGERTAAVRKEVERRAKSPEEVLKEMPEAAPKEYALKEQEIDRLRQDIEKIEDADYRADYLEQLEAFKPGKTSPKKVGEFLSLRDVVVGMVQAQRAAADEAHAASIVPSAEAAAAALAMPAPANAGAPTPAEMEAAEAALTRVRISLSLAVEDAQGTVGRLDVEVPEDEVSADMRDLLVRWAAVEARKLGGKVKLAPIAPRQKVVAVEGVVGLQEANGAAAAGESHATREDTGGW